MLRHSDSTTRSPGPAPLVTSLLLGPTDHPTQSKQGKSRKRTAVPTPTLQRSDDNGPNLTLIPQMDTVADPTDLPFTATAPPVDSDSELRLHQPHYQTASVTQRSLLDNFAIPGQSSVPSHGLHNPLNVSSDNPQDIPHSLPTHSANVLPAAISTDIDDERSGEDNRNAQSTIYDRLDDQRRELDNTWGQDRAIPVSGIDTHSECESNRSRMESQFADRLFHLEQDFSDEIQTSRQQVEKKITYFRIGRLPDREGHDFGAIYKAMPDARRRFTVKLVQKYAWLKEEMTESVARNVAQYCLSARHLEYLQLNCQTRPQYVGHFLKMVLRSGKQQIENEFLNALQTEGRDGIRFTNEVEQLLVTREKMKAFEDLQTERNQYHISEERLPNVCFHSVEVDILNDHLFSRLFFSYKEHSDIEEYNRSSMFFETFRKCQENVFDAFKCICDTNGIFINGNAQRDNSRITDVIIDEPSTPPSLQTIGIETIHTNEGSLVMILKLTEEHSLTNLKDKCEDGSIGDVLIDLLQRKDVRERLNAGTYDFKMKLHATTEDAHFVEMKIEGTIFDQKDIFNNYFNSIFKK
ncbi:uncharacterized protein LOC128244400 [Mya arenaria]|uniref:uncharacterized protein LOC128244400 n=1 Tax=Mya arenaria TaxID=6604 RepID=UPI0022E58D0C|nr:uncharacterized protein LOC128244400 [Mya arenaria]